VPSCEHQADKVGPTKGILAFRRIVGLISLPIDVLPAILQVLIAERFKFIAANSNKAVPASMASVSR
jgi:hypothetical protein